MKIKPTHLREAARVLDEGDYASAEDAARAVIETIDRLRANDLTYMVVREYIHPTGVTFMGYGPFPTTNTATKAVEKGHVGLAGHGNLAIVPVRSHESVLARLASIDELDTHLAGGTALRVREVRG